MQRAAFTEGSPSRLRCRYPMTLRTESCVQLSGPWVWAPVLLFTLLAAVVAAAGWNRPLFFFFNGWSEITGTALWAHLTILGDGLAVFVLALFFVGRRSECVWGAILAGLIISLTVHGMKELVALARPPAVLLAEQINIIGSGYRRRSFPSGHTAAAFGLAALLVLTLPRRAVWLRLPVVALAMAVGLSRVVVGVHWPVDVLVGAALGWLGAALGLALASRWRWGLKAPVQRVLAGFLVLCAVAFVVRYETGYPEARLLQVGLGALMLLLSLAGIRKVYQRGWRAGVGRADSEQ